MKGASGKEGCEKLFAIISQIFNYNDNIQLAIDFSQGTIVRASRNVHKTRKIRHASCTIPQVNKTGKSITVEVWSQSKFTMNNDR